MTTEMTYTVTYLCPLSNKDTVAYRGPDLDKANQTLDHYIKLGVNTPLTSTCRRVR